MRWAALALGLLGTGCFIGYDSRWGQQKQAQQHFAAAETPKALRGEPRDGPFAPRSIRTERVRVRATAAYAAQVVDWQRRFHETLATANGVLEPTVGIRLEVTESVPWNPAGGEDHIARLLDALCADDPADDVDWVVGLVGAVPRFEESFHELGMGEVLGKHVVIRSINHAKEYEAFELGLTELSDDERAKVRQARLSHKASTVLLHELGHTLGALHEDDATSIMGPRYSKKVTRFSPPALEVMRLAVEHRTSSGRLDDDGQKAMAERLQTDPAPWVASEREHQVARLTKPSASVGATTSGGTPTHAPSRLSAADAALFETARRKLDAGDAEGAGSVAAPLFTRYSDEANVQALRCDIAMKRGGSWTSVRTECAEIMRQTTGFH